jgi:hypothetical protein
MLEWHVWIDWKKTIVNPFELEDLSVDILKLLYKEFLPNKISEYVKEGHMNPAKFYDERLQEVELILYKKEGKL